MVDESTDIFMDVASKPYSWIELEEYQWVDPPRLWEAVSGEGWTRKWSLFQLHLLFSPRPCTKAMGKTSKIAASYFCILPSDWPERFNYSIQVKPNATNGLTTIFWQSVYVLAVWWEIFSIIMLFNEIKTYPFIS